jgi:hypothetical protein
MAPKKLPSAQSRPGFVRSWDTETSVAKSQAELEALLRRYLAHGYTVSADYVGRTLVISFTLPRTWQVKTEETIEIRLTVSFGETERRLNKLEAFTTRARGKRDGGVWAREQPERVAWRHVVLLVQAGLEAAASGIQTVEEAFFAHSVLPGTPHRVIDVVHQHRKQLTGGTH